MAIIKCKMCGGDLVLTEGQSVAECDFCGSVQTIPNLDDEKKLIQFERAERLRRQCEFDKAAGIYETIVADFRQEAEAYWGLVLCKFGIEYVDDPATGKKIPTCHRSSFDSIMDDSDFEQALENADPVARKIYRDEAKAIEEIRKGIIAVSNNEQPYDIFICYKETAENGDRTLDSVLAQDVYDALTDKGYRVFFSRITLEDKLGVEYEPYIFAALNSAKIMLAFGTDYEYFNAVWVKNEWSRFLKLMAKDKEKHLIPCYKGIDAYDMPKEFARLQAQDLGKVGAIQDLLRGIEKIIPRQTVQPAVVQERVVVGGSGNNKIASLLDRGNMALEDGDWAKADSFFEDVLNNDSKNAQAYLGKTLALEKSRTIDAFARKRKDASQYVQGEKLELQPNRSHVDEMVKRFSLPGYVEQSEISKLYDFDLSYHSDVKERSEQYKNEEAYWANHKQLSKAEKFAMGAVAENLQREKKALFAALSDRVKNAEAAEATAKQEVQKRYETHLKQADEQAEKLYNEGIVRREKHYKDLLQIAKISSKVTELTETAEKFEKLGSYQDSKNLAEHCRKHAIEEQAKLDAEVERQRILREKQARERKARNKRITIISAAAICAIIAFIIVLHTVIIPNSKYNDAVVLMNEGKYTEAIATFEALNGYKDSTQKIEECKIGILNDKYDTALVLMQEGKYSEAISAFKALSKHRDSVEKIKECEDAILAEKFEEQYQAAISLMEMQKYVEAITAFEKLNGYKDSVQKIEECEAGIYEGKYQDAVTLMNAKKYTEAIAAFEELNGYKDSVQKIEECEAGIYEGKYQDAVALMNAKKYTEAIAAFEKLNGYKDSAKKITECQNAIQQQNEAKLASQYNSAKQLMDQGKTAEAAIAFGKLGNYKDSKTLSGALWDKVAVRETISAGAAYTVGLKADGTVVAVCSNDGGKCNVSGWKDIVAISARNTHTVGLKADGTVVAVCSLDYGQCKVSGWKDIVAISAGFGWTVGLKVDGTVVAVGENIYGQCKVSGWKDIVAISAGSEHTVGLKASGTVVAIGDNLDGECNVSGWKDIVAISAGDCHTVGLKADGTVVAVGSNYYGQCDVSGWKDIVAIAAGGYHTVGLKADGTVVAVGMTSEGQCKVSGWKNIVAISAGTYHTVGLKADGTVVAVGKNIYGQCNVSGWKNIKVPAKK
jgi:alpha-tubulin suppressor-like RCC1 family protein